MKKFYKYHPYSEYLLSTLRDKIIWFSDLENLNDIFDAKHQIIPFTQEELDKFRTEPGCLAPEIPLEVTRANDFALKQIGSIFKDTGIACFSEVPDSILMWSHYTKAHTGCCLEYEIEEKSKDFQQSFFPVTYSTVHPSVHLDSLFKRPPFFARQIMTTKSIEWAYEKEWRFLQPTANVCVEEPLSLKKVIFGKRMQQEQRNEIHKALSDRPGIVFQEAIPAETEYKIQIRPLT